MKIQIWSFAFALFAALSASATANVTGVSISQSADKLVTVTYSIDACAIVTVDFKTNEVSIGEQNFVDIAGDVNHVVSAGSGHKICWRPDQTWANAIASGTLTAQIKAWDLTSPPDYMVCHMDESCPKLCVRFYTSTNAFPDGGLSNDVYARYRLVMRRIPAAGVIWRMGATGTQRAITGGNQQREMPHLVEFSSDYYIGIYPMTQRQVRNVVGWPRNPSPYNNSNQEASEAYPMNNWSFAEIRGKDIGLDWPTNRADHTAHDVDSGTFIAAIRERIGIDSFDLPTRAQYEFATRAGCGNNFYNGVDTPTAEMTANTPRYCWYGVSSIQKVGQLPPNPWGLYDMVGNCFVWTLDRGWLSSTLSNAKVKDPPGADAKVGTRFLMGNPWNATLLNCHNGSCSPAGETLTGRADFGARVVCDVDMSTLAR